MTVVNDGARVAARVLLLQLVCAGSGLGLTVSLLIIAFFSTSRVAVVAGIAGLLLAPLYVLTCHVLVALKEATAERRRLLPRRA